jgi:hypothetical protein
LLSFADREHIPSNAREDIVPMTSTSTVINQHDDLNGSLADDWETYKAYTKFYYITDEVFLYANPILIIIGRIDVELGRETSVCLGNV